MKVIEKVEWNYHENWWTHDSVIHDMVIGRVNEPLKLITDEGEEFLPTSLVYRKDKNGERRFRNDRYTRDLVDYVRDPIKLPIMGLDEYLLVDRNSETFVAGVPIKNTEFISAGLDLEKIDRYLPGAGKALQRVTENLPQFEFGIIGSLQLGLNGEGSDIDLFVYGGARFLDVRDYLLDEDVQNRLRITFQDENRIREHTAKYQKRYGISYEHARDIAVRRARFLIEMDNNEHVKLGLNGNHKKGSYEGLSILGSTREGFKRIVGRVTSIEHSCSYPREYELDTTQGTQRIASHHWGHQLLVAKNEYATAEGYERTTIDGKKVIFLEDEGGNLIRPVPQH